MDFKVCGTADGITACQMDIKIEGLSYEILRKGFKSGSQWKITYTRKITSTIEKPENN